MALYLNVGAFTATEYMITAQLVEQFLYQKWVSVRIRLINPKLSVQTRAPTLKLIVCLYIEAYMIIGRII